VAESGNPMSDDAAYPEQRARQKRDAARQAGTSRARAIHVELAQLYEQRIAFLMDSI
jgi:hypothetical protein